MIRILSLLEMGQTEVAVEMCITHGVFSQSHACYREQGDDAERHKVSQYITGNVIHDSFLQFNARKDRL